MQDRLVTILKGDSNGLSRGARALVSGWKTWAALALTQRYALFGAAIVAVCLALIGALIGNWAFVSATRHLTYQASISDFVLLEARLVQFAADLVRANEFGPDAVAGLDRVLEDLARDTHGTALAIYRPDGTTAYSSRPGRAPSASLAGAGLEEILAGRPHAALSRQSGFEGETEFLRLWLPLRSPTDGEVVGMVEYHKSAAGLRADLRWAAIKIWLAVGLAALLLLVALIALARRHGGLLGGLHRRAISSGKPEFPVSGLGSGQQVAADRRARAADAGIGEADAPHQTYAINERMLRRIGTDLHDGPAQLLSLALLRLEGLEALVASQSADFQSAPVLAGSRSRDTSTSAATDRAHNGVVVVEPGADGMCGSPGNELGNSIHCLKLIRGALNECLREIRLTSSRLSGPEIGSRPVAEALNVAIQLHRETTGEMVDYECSPLEREPDLLVKFCLYRVVQEGLANAAKHAPGSRTRVGLRQISDQLALAITDNGPGACAEMGHGWGRVADADQSDLNETQLGLKLLKNRVESLGGTFSVDFRPGLGAELNVQFELTDDEIRDPVEAV